ncbi:MAG: phage tail protein [Microvirga sp.]
MLRLVRAQETELPREVEVGFSDGEAEYRRAAVASRRLAGASRREARADAAVVTRRVGRGRPLAGHGRGVARERRRLRARPDGRPACDRRTHARAARSRPALALGHDERRGCHARARGARLGVGRGGAWRREPVPPSRAPICAGRSSPPLARS